ncbi:MAG: hypothetical protein IPJ76_08115 [Flavobacteriales bacterium]|nr:MAG: hypothetical protein IPJ76_08115 [Flavobacteriales bacterium]
MSRPRNEGPVTLAFALAGAAFLVRLLSEGVPDSGDGVAHYQIARYAWKHPLMLFDAWGKPLYTLLASPFAQWGLWGPALMNALLAAATGVLIIGQVARVQRAWCWAVPVMLFAAPQYAHTVMAGLTEPLFAFLVVWAVVCALRDRWAWALGIVSFVPFARPEHIAVLPMILLVAAWQREWRALPWVLLGTVFHGVFGFVMTGDPFVAFGGNPYAGVTTYGTGPATHFIGRMPHYYGWPIIVCASFALVAWPYVWRRDGAQREQHLMVLLLAFVPAVLILGLHSYAWWKGGHGSLGLDRVMATCLPLLVLFTVHVLALLWKRFPMNAAMRPVFTLLVGAFALFAYPHVVDELLLPYKPDMVQTTLRKAAEKVKEIKEEGERVYCMTPLVGALLDLDPRDEREAQLLYEPASIAAGSGIRPGDIVVWDAHHARMDARIPLDTLMQSDRFSLLTVVKPEVPTLVLGEVPFEVYLFQRRSVQRAAIVDTLFGLSVEPAAQAPAQVDTVGGATKGTWVLSALEFPLTWEGLPLGNGTNAVMEKLVVTGNVDGRYGKDSLDLVFTEEETGEQVRYASAPLRGGEFKVEWDIGDGARKRANKLYVWNRSGREVRITSWTVTRSQWMQHEVP